MNIHGLFNWQLVNLCELQYILKHFAETIWKIYDAIIGENITTNVRETFFFKYVLSLLASNKMLFHKKHTPSFRVKNRYDSIPNNRLNVRTNEAK